MKLKEILLKNENIDEIINEIIQSGDKFCYLMSFAKSHFVENQFLEISQGIFVISAKDMLFIISEKDLRTPEGFIEFDTWGNRDSHFKRRMLTVDDEFYNDFMRYIGELGFSEYQFKDFGKTTGIAFTFKEAGENALINFNNDFIFHIIGNFVHIKFENNVEIKTTENSVTYISTEWILNICYTEEYTDSIIFCERKNNTFFYTNNLTDLKNFLIHRKEENEDVYE